MAGAGDALLDQAAAEVGVDQTTLRTGDGLRHAGVGNAFAAGETGQPTGFENTQAPAGLRLFIVL